MNTIVMTIRVKNVEEQRVRSVGKTAAPKKSIRCLHEGEGT